MSESRGQKTTEQATQKAPYFYNHTAQNGLEQSTRINWQRRAVVPIVRA